MRLVAWCEEWYIKVFDLEFETDHYYIKRPSIVEQIRFDNRTFYAKFERIEEPLTPLLLQQHLNKQYTIAVPLLKEGLTDYLVLEYKGEEHQRFAPLVKHLFGTLGITDYHIYRGRDEEKIQVFIKVNHLSLTEAEEQLQAISDKLKQRLTKRWKTLPSTQLPEAYNIVTLPYSPI
jgi:L-rhamnose mutarotase